MLRSRILLLLAPNLQRDYAILGNRPYSNALDAGLVSEEDAESEDEGDHAEIEASEAATDIGDDPRSDTDNLSSLSLTDEHGQRSNTKTDRRSSRSSNAVQSPPLRPKSPNTANEHSRGSRSANLYQATGSSPTRQRRPSMARSETNGGFPQWTMSSSFLLGGHHMMPPEGADMRSHDQLDYATTSTDEDLDHLRPSDHDLTPRPGMQKQVASPSLASQTHPSEHSPLLSASVHTGHGVSSHAGYGTTSTASADAKHHQHTGFQSATSGWHLSQPAPPNESQIELTAHEPQVNLHRREFHILIQFALPIWACHLLELSLNVVSVFSLGHLGTNELAAASLSSMTANVTGFSILVGFISALDSILPGAYTSQPKMVGLYAQRMMVIVVYLLVPISLVWYFSENILLALGQEPIVAALAAQYLRTLAFGVPGYAGFEVCRRYLQAQGLMHAPTMVLLVASPINVLLNWLLVWGPDSFRLGFLGAPIASVISMWLMCILGFLQCYVAPRVAWDGWSTLAFTGLEPLVKLGVAGTLAMCSEWWSWEIVGLVTSKLGTIALASQSVLLVCSSISYQLPYALSAAVAVRIGNLLGAAQADHARISSDMGILLSILAGILNSTFFLVTRSWIGWTFSEDQAVVELVTSIVPLLALFQVADGICGVIGGILRGTGQQGAGAIINLTGYYVIGMLTGVGLTHHGSLSSRYSYWSCVDVLQASMGSHRTVDWSDNCPCLWLHIQLLDCGSNGTFYSMSSVSSSLFFLLRIGNKRYARPTHAWVSTKTRSTNILPLCQTHPSLIYTAEHETDAGSVQTHTISHRYWSLVTRLVSLYQTPVRLCKSHPLYDKISALHARYPSRERFVRNMGLSRQKRLFTHHSTLSAVSFIRIVCNVIIAMVYRPAIIHY